MAISTDETAVEVTLTWFEMFQAATVGAMRQIEALKRNRTDRHGYKGDGWSIHINGAAAELAVAKASGRFWHALHHAPAELPGDVGRLQVRWRSKPLWDLIVHDDDPDDAYFVLVVGDVPKLSIVGFIRGAEAKQKSYYQDPAGGRPAYFVPQAELAPFGDLIGGST